jgi:hypothetical protein
MAFDQISPPHGGRCGIVAIQQFWDGVLKRLKVHAELAALRVQPSTVTNPDSTIDGDATQPGQRDD